MTYGVATEPEVCQRLKHPQRKLAAMENWIRQIGRGAVSGGLEVYTTEYAALR